MPRINAGAAGLPAPVTKAPARRAPSGRRMDEDVPMSSSIVLAASHGLPSILVVAAAALVARAWIVRATPVGVKELLVPWEQH